MHNRRIFVILAVLTVFASAAAAKGVPKNNPVAHYGLAWTDTLNWSNAVNIADMPGDTPAEKLAAAQAKLAGAGGVVFFPKGKYAFEDTITLKSGIVLRGDRPTKSDARNDEYDAKTKFVFPRYVPTFEGNGTANDTAFKGIHLEDPGKASNCGLVNLSVDHGHIEFQEDKDHGAGRNRIVFGCVVRNAAIPDRAVPAKHQHAWQRWTQRHHAAIHVKSGENMLIANNRVPPSDANFAMKGFKMFVDRKNVKDVIELDVTFDYDLRPGIYANPASAGGGWGKPRGTPETHPWGFRKGLVIRDNYIFCTASPGIMFTGDGTICSFNVIKFKPGVLRHTIGGIYQGHFTGNIRAIEMRGYRWTVEGNYYEVYRNHGKIGADGEGLMHEAHHNSPVKDSKLLYNRGNAYLCLWRLPIDGLLIKGNIVRGTGFYGDGICVLANDKQKKLPCSNVTVEDNILIGGNIRIDGVGTNNIIRNNRFLSTGHRRKIINDGNALVEGNVGFD